MSLLGLSRTSLVRKWSEHSGSWKADTFCTKHSAFEVDFEIDHEVDGLSSGMDHLEIRFICCCITFNIIVAQHVGPLTKKPHCWQMPKICRSFGISGLARKLSQACRQGHACDRRFRIFGSEAETSHNLFSSMNVSRVRREWKRTTRFTRRDAIG